MLEEIRTQIAGIIAPEFVEKRNQLEREANTDALTQIPNRRAFEKARGKARRDGMAFIIFDANNFKLVNKVASHAEGDKVLQYYANVVSNVAAKFKARAFRLGGDEFVIICLNRFSARVRDAVEYRALPQRFTNFTVSLSGEIGMSLEEADSKLQARKIARKNSDRSFALCA